jgi:hypothetical protein
MDQLKEGAIGSEKRSEPRKIIEDYYSVEFSVSPELPVHQFKVRDISPSGIGILVNESSAVLEHLAVGDVLKMKYNPANPSDSAEYLRTEIRHITKVTQGRFKGHCQVGMLILERPER